MEESHVRTSGSFSTPTEWKLNNQARLSQAQLERLAAERLVAESRRLRDEVTTRVTTSRREVSQHFSQRLRDIHFWKASLDQKIAETKNEIDSLTQCHMRLQRMTKACADPISVVEQCLRVREKRTGVDRCLDEVQLALHDELRTLRQAESSLTKTCTDSAEQLRLLRAAKYQLEKDAADKAKAAEIDGSTAEIPGSTNASNTTLSKTHLQHSSWTPDVLLSETTGRNLNESTYIKANKQTSPAEWQSFTEQNMHQASHEIHRSIQLRETAESLMQDSAREIRVNASRVDHLFQEITDRTRKALDAMTKEHSMVMEQIRDTEEESAGLRNAILAQDAPLGGTYEQLMRRASRPNVELCRDSVHEILNTRVEVVRGSLSQLKEKLNQAERQLKKLRQSKFDLEKEINLKTSTLRLDSEHCVNGLRRNMVLPQP